MLNTPLKHPQTKQIQYPAYKSYTYFCFKGRDERGKALHGGLDFRLNLGLDKKKTNQYEPQNKLGKSKNERKHKPPNLMACTLQPPQSVALQHQGDLSDRLVVVMQCLTRKAAKRDDSRRIPESAVAE